MLHACGASACTWKAPTPPASSRGAGRSRRRQADAQTQPCDLYVVEFGPTGPTIGAFRPRSHRQYPMKILGVELKQPTFNEVTASAVMAAGLWLACVALLRANDQPLDRVEAGGALLVIFWG